MANLRLPIALLQLWLLRITSAQYLPYTSASSPSDIILTPTSYIPYPVYPTSIPANCSQHAPNTTQSSWSTHSLTGTASHGLPTVITISSNSMNTTYHSPTPVTSKTISQQTAISTAIVETSSTEENQATSMPSQAASSTAPSEPLFTAGAARNPEMSVWKWTLGVGVLVGGVGVGI